MIIMTISYKDDNEKQEALEIIEKEFRVLKIEKKSSNDFEGINTLYIEIDGKPDWRELVAESDRKSRMEGAYKEGVFKVAKNMLQKGESVQEVADMFCYNKDVLEKVIQNNFEYGSVVFDALHKNK